MPNGKPGDIHDSDSIRPIPNQFGSDVAKLVQEIYRLNNNNSEILEQIDWSNSKSKRQLKKRLKDIIKSLKK